MGSGSLCSLWNGVRNHFLSDIVEILSFTAAAHRTPIDPPDLKQYNVAVSSG